MGRTCRVCGRSRPNEKFGGKGLRASVCAKCRRRPKEELQRILAIDEMYDFLLQSNITAKNIERLVELESIAGEDFQQFRNLVLEIAAVHPRKRKRWINIPQRHTSLFRRIVESEQFDYLLVEFCRPDAYEYLDSQHDHPFETS